MKLDARVKTPCIGVCSTGLGDSVCRGCKRYMHEVVHWNAYSEPERRKVVSRLSVLLKQVAEPIIEIRDRELLLKSLKYQNVRFDEHADPYVWVLELLKMGAASLSSLEPFGCDVRYTHAHLTLIEIRDLIDRDYYTLSEVHYQRYFNPAI